MAAVRVIGWSKTLCGVGSKVLLGWKQLVLGYIIILPVVLFRNFQQSCCLLQMFCCETLKILHPCLCVLNMFPDLGRAKKTEAGKCIRVMFEKVINPSWIQK